jgi:3-oxoacyl-[acyl-carrier protein] reductase
VLRDAGLQAASTGLDIRDGDAVAEALDAHAPTAQVLVNHAGLFSDKPFMSLTEGDFEAMLGVNVVDTFVVGQEVLKRMPDGGRIVHIASRAVLAQRSNAHYAASKSTLIGLTRTIAMELGSRGITVNAIASGLIDTPMLDGLSDAWKTELIRLQPTGQMGTPEDIAHAAAFLASPASGFITGHVLFVDGGKSPGGGAFLP